MSHVTSHVLVDSECELARRAAVAAGTAARAAGPEPGSHAEEDEAARHALRAVAEAGLTGYLVPSPYSQVEDATAVSTRAICVIRDELAYASGLADVMFVMQGLGSAAISLEGSHDLKARYLPGVARGEIIAAFAMTEPEAGSDVGSISARAVREGDQYVLDGVKTYISNAGLADLYTVFARTGPEAQGRKGISAFALDAAMPGFTIKERLTVIAPHPIGTLEMSGCRVPSSHLIGREGDGFDLAMRVLEKFRPTVGAAAAGLARRALDESLNRARTRRQFGRPLAEMQAIRFKLADMAMWLDAARLMVMRAASMVDRMQNSSDSSGAFASRRASAMAKLFATEAAQRIVDEAVQIHGGLGVTKGHVVERLYREVRALRIYEGTSEIQRSIIARTLLKES